MNRWLVVWALIVLIIIVLLGSPAAFWARWVDWPDDWQPQSISGTLWNGQTQQIGPLGPVSWQLKLAGPGADVQVGALQRHWLVALRGWPWKWQASLQDGGSTATPEQPVRLEGQWEGRIDISGRGQACESSVGSLVAPQLDLLSPWAMPLGHGEISLDCAESPRLHARLEQPGQHRFDLRADLTARTTELSGTAAKASELGGLLRQFGLLGQGQESFQTRFVW